MTDAAPLIDTTKQEVGFDLSRWLMTVRDEYGKGLGATVLELARLVRGFGQLTVEEYFMYHLFDDKRFEAQAKQSFVGHRFQKRLDLEWIKNAWTHIAADKPALTMLLKGMELPVPQTQALAHPYRTFAGAACPRDASELATFLRAQAVYPVFCKPTDSVNSLGAASIDAYEADSDSLRFHDGSLITVDAFVETASQFIAGGYLIQSRMAPHPDLAPLLGGKLGTCRVFCFVDDEGPVLWRASMRIPTGDNVADNFWRPGNLLAGLDPETGEILRVVQNLAQQYAPLDTHPDTDAPFAGFTVPDWDKVRSTVLTAVAAIPHCHVQGWDVAITDKGPVLVELEGDGGHPMMVQLPREVGLYEGRYAAFCKWAQQRVTERSKQSTSRLSRARGDVGSLFKTRNPQGSRD